MPEPETQNQTTSQPVSKQYDVALVEPHNPTIEVWPRARVMVQAASAEDVSSKLTTAEKVFATREVERQRAIDAYSDMYGISTTDLRWDVVEAAPGSPEPIEPENWKAHRHFQMGAPYYRGRDDAHRPDASK